MLHIRYILYLSCLYHLLLWMVSYARFCKHLFISLTIMEASYGICSIEIHIYLSLWKPHMWFVLYTSKKYHLLLWNPHMWFILYTSKYITYYYESSICDLLNTLHYMSLIIMEAPYVYCSIDIHVYHLLLRKPHMWFVIYTCIIIYHFLLWKPHMCFVLYTCIIIYLLLLWKTHMWFVKCTSLYITSYYGSPICVLFYTHA